jgi:hypothetical protein
LQEASKLDIQTTLVQTLLCANETSTGPLPMSLIGGANNLSGQVCYGVSKEKKMVALRWPRSHLIAIKQPI